MRLRSLLAFLLLAVPAPPAGAETLGLAWGVVVEPAEEGLGGPLRSLAAFALPQ
jgi:hypothetical protein